MADWILHRVLWKSGLAKYWSYKRRHSRHFGGTIINWRIRRTRSFRNSKWFIKRLPLTPTLKARQTKYFTETNVGKANITSNIVLIVCLISRHITMLPGNKCLTDEAYLHVFGSFSIAQIPLRRLPRDVRKSPWHPCDKTRGSPRLHRFSPWQVGDVPKSVCRAVSC